MKFYDITRTITPQTAVWPQVASPEIETVLQIQEGFSVNLTQLHLSPHTGTHADAYFHYEQEGEHPAKMPLESYIGHCHVVSTHKHNGALLPSDFPILESVTTLERLLIHTPISDIPHHSFPETFPYLSVQLLTWLKSKGCVLVGLDSPSVDALESKTLDCHHALKTLGMVNLEFLDLRHVPDGEYELIALPLKLDQTCASPVRAVLRTLNA